MKKYSHQGSRPLSPEQYIEYVLCDLNKASKRIRTFHKDYHTYLITQRNLLLDEILQSLKEFGKKRKKGIFYRVVLSQYMNDPLSTAGSILHSGRFNFGSISYDYKSFPCIYVSSDAIGAQCEKFPNREYKILSTKEMSLVPNRSFLTSRCEVNLTKCIDIRTPASLKKFTKIISQINPTEQFQKKWKKLNRKVRGENKTKPLRTIKTLQELYQSLYAEHLSRTGENLSLVVEYLYKNHRYIFDEIIKKLSERVPGITRVESKQTEEGRILLKFQDGDFEDPFLARYVSDGTIKMLAYLVLLYDPTPHPLLCVEEPENQLYHNLLEELAEEFRSYANKGGQVFVSTHSPDFLNSAELDEVFWLKKEKGWTTVKKAKDDSQISTYMEKGDKMGHLWREGLFKGVDPK